MSRKRTAGSLNCAFCTSVPGKSWLVSDWQLFSYSFLEAAFLELFFELLELFLDFFVSLGIAKLSL
jgi:hypothetical protein